MAPAYLTREQARKIDESAVSRCGLSTLILMENAGRGCADTLERLAIRGPVVICCGVGNNGGDGLVIARHLDLRGFAARVLLWGDPNRLQGDAAVNYQILVRCGIPPAVFTAVDERLDEQLEGADWIVDALLGTGASGEPRAPLGTLLERLNAQPARRLAVDVPSGLDCDTGQPATRTFRADHTCTFVAPKRGFAQASAFPFLGTVHVLDIGISPRFLGAP